MLLALVVAAQADTKAKCTSRCEMFFDSCMTHNTASKDACHILKDCTSSSTNCDEACKQACSWCDNYWGHFIKSGCGVDRTTCLSSCK